MSTTIERVIPLVGQLPASIREMLARRLRELAGVGLIGIAGVAAAALMTWSVQDPSLSHATSRAIRNVVGYPGAIGADLMMQILGLGAIMLVLPVAVWGWRMITHRHFDREALRIGCWILCTILASGFASCWQHGGSWPLPTGVGGVVGDALFRAPAVVFGPVGFIYRLVLGIILCAAMTVTFLIACGFGAKQKEHFAEIEDDDAPFEEEDASDRGSVSLGWIVHAAMSAKARLGRLLSGIYGLMVASAPDKRSAAFERQEPNLGGRRARARPSLRNIATMTIMMARTRSTTKKRTRRSSPRRSPVRRARSRRKSRRARPAAHSSCPRSACSPHRVPPIANRSARPSSKPIRARSKSCSAISAYAARSSRRIPVRW